MLGLAFTTYCLSEAHWSHIETRQVPGANVSASLFSSERHNKVRLSWASGRGRGDVVLSFDCEWPAFVKSTIVEGPANTLHAVIHSNPALSSRRLEVLTIDMSGLSARKVLYDGWDRGFYGRLAVLRDRSDKVVGLALGCIEKPLSGAAWHLQAKEKRTFDIYHFAWNPGSGWRESMKSSPFRYDLEVDAQFDSLVKRLSPNISFWVQ